VKEIECVEGDGLEELRASRGHDRRIVRQRVNQRVMDVYEYRLFSRSSGQC
jgi:hypothetical protein